MVATMKTHDNPTQNLIKNHYSLATEEIKIERQINDMVHRLRHLHHQKQAAYLQNEITHLKRRLDNFRQDRLAH